MDRPRQPWMEFRPTRLRKFHSISEHNSRGKMAAAFILLRADRIPAYPIIYLWARAAGSTDLVQQVLMPACSSRAQCCGETDAPRSKSCLMHSHHLITAHYLLQNHIWGMWEDHRGQHCTSLISLEGYRDLSPLYD